jgi:hypothetical protein
MTVDAKLKELLVDVRSWCEFLERETHSSAPGSLRSAGLKPDDLMMSDARIRGLTEAEIHARRTTVVQTVVLKRRRLLYEKSPTFAPSPLLGAAILATELDASFFDGVAAVESDGFFDSEDLSPWDTWLEYRTNVAARRGVLLSFVPPHIVEVVEHAMAVHVADAYFWFAKEDGV